MQPNNNLLMVDARHNGPPGSGNGGWTAGLIAAHITEGVPEVTLRKPPPLETPLTVIHALDGVRVVDPSEVVIATARSRHDDIAAVPAVSQAEALAASQHYPGHGHHHFPTCFVCGPQRPDGLRIFPGKLGDGRTAAIFETPPDLEMVTVWAALDCPGGWTVIGVDRPWVLGRLAVAVDELPKPGEQCVITGQLISGQGRKALVRTTLHRPDGVISARAEATWIAV